MKRIIAVLLLTVMMLSLVSCGGEKSEDGIVITWLVPGDAQKDTKLVLDEINKIMEPELGVKLDLQFIAQSAYAEKMKMNMASGTPYDLCFTSSWLNNYNAAARDGGLYDITDMISDNLKSQLSDDIWKGSEVDGRLYAVPNNQMMIMQYCISFRKDLVEKYADKFDVSKVKKMEDIEPFLELVRDNEPDLYPYNSGYASAPFTTGLFNAPVNNTGIGIRLSTMEFVNTLEQPEVIEAENIVREWFKKGFIRSDYASAGGDGGAGSADVKQGKYAVKIDTWKPGIEAMQTGVPYVYVPIGVATKNPPTATMTAVGANSKHPEEAMKVIEFFYTNKEAYNLICYGIEGTHYNFNDEGKLVQVENSGYVPQGDWKFGNQFNAHISEGMPDDIWEQTQKANDEAIALPTTGFVFNTDPVKNELAQIASVFAEYYDFVTVPESEYADYKARKKKALQDAGYDKLFKEIEKQVREFWKANNLDY